MTSDKVTSLLFILDTVDYIDNHFDDKQCGVLAMYGDSHGFQFDDCTELHYYICEGPLTGK